MSDALLGVALVVEDDQTQLVAATRLVTSLGHTVLTAKSAEEALEIVANVSVTSSEAKKCLPTGAVDVVIKPLVQPV